MRSVRRIVESVTRHWVLRRHLPLNLGRGVLYVTPGAGGLRFLKPNLRDADPCLFDLVDELVVEGMAVWDVGANVGLFAFSAARRAGPSGFVLAIEPDLDNVALLQKTRGRLDRAHSAPVEVLAAAILDGQTPFAQLSIAMRSRSSNALAGYGNTQMGGVRETRIVPVCSLDALLGSELVRRPDLVKIDIEGAEARAVGSAQHLLREVRPILLLEVSDGDNARQVGRTLLDAGYRMFNADLPCEARRELRSPSWNTLALPG